MLKVNDVSTSVECKVNGRVVPVDLGLATGLEYLVAYELWGRIAGPLNPGYDVYDSALYPGLTFQVKHSSGNKASKQRQLVFLWQERRGGAIADYYILFGVDGEVLRPFLVSLAVWKRRLISCGRGTEGYAVGKANFRITAERFSRRGRHQALRENVMWNHYIHDWPEGLHRRLNDYQQLGLQLAT